MTYIISQHPVSIPYRKFNNVSYGLVMACLAHVSIPYRKFNNLYTQQGIQYD